MIIMHLFRKKRRFVAFILCLLVGLVFITVGRHLFSSRQSLAKNGLAAEATVIRLIKHSSTKSATYRPELEFTTQNGKTIRFVYSTGRNPPAYSVGQRVKVFYLDDKPENAVIDSGFEFLGLPVIFMSSGALFLLVSLILFFR